MPAESALYAELVPERAVRASVLADDQGTEVVLALACVAVGIPLSMWASKYVSTLLFGLTPRDPIVSGLTAITLVAVSSVAGYLPARRAAGVDPAGALKQDRRAHLGTRESRFPSAGFRLLLYR